ncbi:uncharacterized protein LOC135351172 isoform X3 [Halichondria panicea]|uniref:uncharacterized protein LOC135351172 isoform X3 n=1 Tax=Halichondria panicea TaxID=6063 RepID=UPI00312BC073
MEVFPTVLLFSLTVVINARAQLQGSSPLGTQFTVQQSSNGLVVSARLISTNISIQRDAIFPEAYLPSTCGDRLWRCRVTLIKDTPNNREVAIVPHSAGIALALFAGINSDRLTLIDQFVLGPQEEVNCSFTSIAKNPSDNGRVVSCVRFTPLARFEVDLWLFEVHINFETLNQSSLSLLNDNIDTPYQSYSTGLSPIFFSSVDLVSDSRVIWFDDEVLFTVLPGNGNSFSSAEHFYADSNRSVCFGNNVTDVRQSRDLNNLLVYCSENNLINISVSGRGEMKVGVKRTQTRFHCPQGVYIEQRNKTLALVSPGLLDHVIPHPLNLLERYVGDCALTEDAAYFIGTSRDGSIALTNLLDNQTIILADDAQINHQLIDGHVLLFSNSTVSVVQDLACHSQQFSSNETFLLATFELNPDFSCPDQQPVTTPAETTAATSQDKPNNETSPPPGEAVYTDRQQLALGLSIGLSGFVVVVVLAVVFIAVCLCYWVKKRMARSRPTQEVGGEAQGGREDHSANSQAALLNGNNTPENHERAIELAVLHHSQSTSSQEMDCPTIVLPRIPTLSPADRSPTPDNDVGMPVPTDPNTLPINCEFSLSTN